MSDQATTGGRGEIGVEAFVRGIADRPCQATEFYVGNEYGLPEAALTDGIERCLDTDFNEMGSREDQWPWDKPLERCDPCAARFVLLEPSRL